MLKGKSLLLATAGVLTTALSISAFAGGPTAEPMPAVESAASGFTVGSSLINAADSSDYGVLLGYINDQFLVDFNVGYDSINKNSTTSHATSLGGDLGMRYNLTQPLFATFGVNGVYAIVDNKPATLTNPYAVGVFFGLDYQPIKNLLLSAKLDPYMYARDIVNDHLNDVFTCGSLSVSYVFAQ